ncbi:MAG: hypothetical protein QCI82_03715 [Candidatus Thermoplasmatota archaeon]|nr:hypothetical protein [Candidatus Thermoplasmatota archaeon]
MYKPSRRPEVSRDDMTSRVYRVPAFPVDSIQILRFLIVSWSGGVIKDIEEKVSLEGITPAYLCSGGSCSVPAGDPERMREDLNRR